MPAATAQDAARTLDLHEILEDEYAALHPADDPRPLDAGTAVECLFTVQQLRDVPALVRLVCEGIVAVANPSPTRVAVTVIAQGQAELQAEAAALGDLAADSDGLRAGRFRDLLVSRLNELIAGDLVSDRRFRDLRLVAGVVSADASEERRPRANRLLIEAALAPAVARIRDVRLAALYGRARPHAATALCLSGGGIRSCAFALGVATALARRGLLGKFDYLSTVSGGGYLGGWLSAWMKHEGAETVHRSLGSCTGGTLDPDPQPVRHLRAYMSFLAPRLGVLSPDMWTLIGTLIRNLILNWLVIVPLLAGALMVPRLAVSFLRFPGHVIPLAAAPHVLTMVLSTGAFALGTFAIAHVFRHKPLFAGTEEPSGSAPQSTILERTQGAFIRGCLVPIVLAALSFTLSWWLLGEETVNSLPPWVWFGPAMVMALLGWVIGSRRRRLHGMEGVIVAVSSAVAGLLAPRVLYLLRLLAEQRLLRESLHLSQDLLRPRIFVTLAVPIFLLLLMIGGQLFIGLSSTRGTSEDREWNARANGWMLIVIVTWVSVCSIVLFLPPLFENTWQDPKFIGLHALGGLSGVLTALLGASAATPSSNAAVPAGPSSASMTTVLKRAALALAAPVFVVSLLGVISIANAQLLLRDLYALVPPQFRLTPDDVFRASPGEHDHGAIEHHEGDFLSPVVVLLAGVGLLGTGWGLGRFIDTNQFSLHAMYRARLVRTFLGASRSHAERSPDPFTGFDDRDDFPLGTLWPQAESGFRYGDRVDRMPPLHVVNLTLNVVARRSLAWQERKAESMTVSPLHAGGPFLGYRRTRSAASPSSGIYGGIGGISLGTAITISGAAASPEAGYNSSPTVSFLMALFNARLGWWLGNPGPAGDRTFSRPGPLGGVTPVLSEMFGLTTDQSPFVFLSDGGHFDNLGVYSMVLRRCRFIVLSDAGCDPRSQFEDLGNAIRKIRIDLGVPIEFPAGALPFGTTGSLASFDGWAVARIRYSAIDKPRGSGVPDDEYDGVLVYVKPTLSSGEPVDVLNYSHRSSAFPHESTTHQFFTESQFESYRSLGIFETERMCDALHAAAVDPGGGDSVMFAAPMRWLERQRRGGMAAPRPSAETFN